MLGRRCPWWAPAPAMAFNCSDATYTTVLCSPARLTRRCCALPSPCSPCGFGLARLLSNLGTAGIVGRRARTSRTDLYLLLPRVQPRRASVHRCTLRTSNHCPLLTCARRTHASTSIARKQCSVRRRPSRCRRGLDCRNTWSASRSSREAARSGSRRAASSRARTSSRRGASRTTSPKSG